MIRVEIQGLEQAKRGVQVNAQNLLRELGEAVEKSAYAVEAEAKQNLSGRVLNRRTGELRASVHTQSRKDRMEATVGTNVIYGKVHEYGATIRAKGSNYLRFEHPYGSGQWHSVRQVRIPARPWLRTAADSSLGRIRMIFEGAVKKALR